MTPSHNLGWLPHSAHNTEASVFHISDCSAEDSSFAIPVAWIHYHCPLQTTQLYPCVCIHIYIYICVLKNIIAPSRSINLDQTGFVINRLQYDNVGKHLIKLIMQVKLRNKCKK